MSTTLLTLRAPAFIGAATLLGAAALTACGQPAGSADAGSAAPAVAVAVLATASSVATRLAIPPGIVFPEGDTVAGGDGLGVDVIPSHAAGPVNGSAAIGGLAADSADAVAWGTAQAPSGGDGAPLAVLGAVVQKAEASYRAETDALKRRLNVLEQRLRHPSHHA